VVQIKKSKAIPLEAFLPENAGKYANTLKSSETRHVVMHGDVYSCLLEIPDGSLDASITSPPYWAQRDYGFEGQIGAEPSLHDYIKRLVFIFRSIRKKLKESGVFFLNAGDKYISRYGNPPLAMIPWRLAWHMVKDGWRLEDIIIWFKPNHMPSSVKNRFTNTYEPVFVFVKKEKNYYRDYKQRSKMSNVLKIPLQPLPFKHVAPYPEKLVEALLSFGIPENGIVMDPFAGSGTTTKAIQNLNATKNYMMSSIQIEANPEFINIIRDRCSIPGRDIYKIRFKDYDIPIMPIAEPPSRPTIKNVKGFNIKPAQVMVYILKSRDELWNFLELLNGDFIELCLEDDGILFLGIDGHNIDDIYLLTTISGWIIRNIIIIPENNDWRPIFMLVKDIKTIRYRFNLDVIRINHYYQDVNQWRKEDFIGYRVSKTKQLFKEPTNGLITTIISRKSNGLPHWVVVKWDDGNETVEEVINPPVPDRKVEFRCPSCEAHLIRYHHPRKKVFCESCGLELWNNVKNIPRLVLDKRLPPRLKTMNDSVMVKTVKKNYSGKFKDARRINLGQSPGARMSVNERFFSVQRYYNVRQSLICDYLNLYREKAGLSKKQLTDLFPSSYKHTCGHWLRKDMGGSIPKVEDVIHLEKILGLDKPYVQYMTRIGLKFQAVIPDAKGKNPGDFLDKPLTEVIKLLKKLGEW